MAQLKSLSLVLSGPLNSNSAYWLTHKLRPDWGRSLILSSISISKTLATWRLPPKNVMITSHLQFLNVAFGSFGSFLTSTCPPLKHHQPCTLWQSASQLQLNIGALKNCWFVYWGRGLFLWMVQLKSRFRNLKREDGTTQKFVSGTLRVCKFQSCLLAKYFISANNCSCSHINFSQTVEEKLRNRSFAVS